MFSKAIPRKPTGFEVRETENPRWKAQIQLYPEPDSGTEETEMVKLKLRRNPTGEVSATYNKYHVSWSEQTEIGYNNRTIPVEDEKQVSLNKINVFSGTTLNKWRYAEKQLPHGNVWNE